MRREAAAVAAWLLVVVLIACALTGVYALRFRSECTHDGGTFHMTRTLLVCHY
jgi:hypothetical protein